jgi:hypothetical protein
MPPIHPTVQNMSLKDMQRLTIDILESQGKSESEADKIVDSMDLDNLQQFLSEAYDAMDEVEDDMDEVEDDMEE